ncbi:MAG: hypothetical protein KAI66_20660, partial [Lentisphaeria bacterium]|nr:hypothetical protein [Lentisphaeria bacterium]
MKAVFYTADALSWADGLGGVPWPLLPIANRPLLDYWLETCADLGIGHVQVILGEGADQVETFIGSGTRWGVEIQYSFARAAEQPLDYLKSTSDRWKDGLFFISGPLFLRRLPGYDPAGFQTMEACCNGCPHLAQFLFGKNGGEVKMLLDR